MNRKHLLLTLFGLISLALGQELPTVIPPSPDAASMAKFGDIPVSTYTGIPSISVPIHTIQSRDISLPISLDYHASGIKVSEDASSVGLGWSLNAGGAITRSILGLDDFLNGGTYGYGYLNTNSPEITSEPVNFSQASYFENHNSIITDNGIVDLGANALFDQIDHDFQPDQYFYRFPGSSGAFTLKKDGSPFFREKVDMIIEIPDQAIDATLAPGVSIREYPEWTIKTEDGYEYVFGSPDQRTAIEQTYLNDGNANTYTLQGGTTWFLSQIKSPKGEVMDFIYEPITITTGPLRIESGSMEYSLGDLCPDLPGENTFQEPAFGGHEYRTWLLSRIEFTTGFVEFGYDANLREDLEGAKRLSEIKVFTQSNAHPATLTHHFELDNDHYFEGGEWGRQSPLFTDPVLEAYQSKRLKLSAFIQKDLQGGADIHHAFSYYEGTNPQDKLPYKSTFAQDHWGYFNGIMDNYTLVPEYRGLNFFDNTSPITEFGANRNPDATSDVRYANQACLQSITYPTGGTTTFEYEMNTFSNVEAESSRSLIPGSYKVQSNAHGQNYDVLNFYVPEGAGQTTITLAIQSTLLSISALDPYDVRLGIRGSSYIQYFSMADFDQNCQGASTNCSYSIVRTETEMPAGWYTIFAWHDPTYSGHVSLEVFCKEEVFTPVSSGDQTTVRSFPVQTEVRRTAFEAGPATSITVPGNQVGEFSYDIIFRYDKSQIIFDNTGLPASDQLYVSFTNTATNAVYTIDFGQQLADWISNSASQSNECYSTYQSNVPPNGLSRWECRQRGTINNTDLPSGTYLIEVVDQYTQGSPPAAAELSTCKVSVWASSDPNHLVEKGGGLRIKKITSDPHSLDPPIVKEFVYDYDITMNSSQVLVSSGRLMSKPTYEGLYIQPMYQGYVLNGVTWYLTGECASYRRFARSMKPLSTGAQGAHVGYDQVTLLQGYLGSEGKTVYSYYNEADREINYNGQTPISGTPNVPASRNGLLLKEEVYKHESNTFQLVQETSYEYNDTQSLETFYGIHIKPLWFTLQDPNSNGASIYIGNQYFLYPIESDLAQLTGTTVKTYDQHEASFFIETRTEYSYDPITFLPKKTTQIHSDGTKTIQENYYVAETSSSAGTALASMKDKHALHMNHTLVEQVSKIEVGGVEKTIGAVNYEFQVLNGIPLAQGVHSLEADQPLTDFQPFVQNNTRDSRYQEAIEYLDYTQTGKLSTVRRSGDEAQSYLWGHSQTKPIANIINAAADEVAYSSFEGDDKSWILSGTATPTNQAAKTGSMSLNLLGGGALTSDVLPDGTYIVSFWVNGAVNVNFSGNGYISHKPELSKTDPNGWTYHEYQMGFTGVGSIAISGTGLVDEARIYPADARMTTYCYDEQLRLQSINDVNNVSQHFEYDGMNRLHQVRDFEGNILSRNHYNLK